MFQPECDKRVSQSLKHANSQKHSLDQRSFIYLVFARSDYSTACCQSIFVPMGPITSIGHGPACPSHLPLDSLSVPHTTIQQANQRVESPKGPPIKLIIRRCYYGSLERSVLMMRTVNEGH